MGDLGQKDTASSTKITGRDEQHQVDVVRESDGTRRQLVNNALGLVNFTFDKVEMTSPTNKIDEYTYFQAGVQQGIIRITYNSACRRSIVMMERL